MKENSSNTNVDVDVNTTCNIPDIKEFLKAGVQFGHETIRWNPKMSKYIFGIKNKIHIIDLEKTLPMLKEACQFLTNASKRGPVLFVATKRQAREIVEKYAIESGSYFVTYRWLGGLLTNFKMIKKSLNRYIQIEDEFEKGVVNRTKFEVNQLKKEWERMNRIYKGVKFMDRFPSAVVLVDCHYEKGALMEAKTMNIPVVAMVDTNSDPDLVDYVIPSNDDASKSLNLILGILADSIKKGNEGRGVRHEFKDYSNYQVQIIKKQENEAKTEESIINSNEKKEEKDIKIIKDVKPRGKSKPQKGILEMVKEEAKKENKVILKKKEIKKPLKKVTKKTTVKKKVVKK